MTSEDLSEDVHYAVVIPTLVRGCLDDCLDALDVACANALTLPGQVVVVDDRDTACLGAPIAIPTRLMDRTQVVEAGGMGPGGARNLGWRRTTAPWVVFIDDDVQVCEDWCNRLADDLHARSPHVGGVQGRIIVRLPAERRPTAWERTTAGLTEARWITADMAYRREALVESGGFDTRFPRAFREDADLALRVTALGWRLEQGDRRSRHLVRAASPWISVRSQAGNADDALMRALHGPRWRERVGATSGRRPQHLMITAAGLIAAALTMARRPRAALVAAGGALGGVAEYAASRIGPGPRTTREITVMVMTSLAIPPTATWHWLKGIWRARSAPPWPLPARAILFDRDGTLIRDVPYIGDPDRVEPMPGARRALDSARRAGLRIGVITNQSGIARGLLRPADVAAVNAKVKALLGPIDTWQQCSHGDEDGCDCRKPAPGLVLMAAADLGLAPEECLVVGDIGADVGAARAAGARSVLIPQRNTRPQDAVGVRTAARLDEAVRFALTGGLGKAVWS